MDSLLKQNQVGTNTKFCIVASGDITDSLKFILSRTLSPPVRVPDRVQCLRLT